MLAASESLVRATIRGVLLVPLRQRCSKVTGDTWSYKGIAMRHIPLWAYEEWVSRATDWLAMTEDLPDENNRVRVTPDGRIVLEYRPNNTRAHAQLVDELRGILQRIGY